MHDGLRLDRGDRVGRRQLPEYQAVARIRAGASAASSETLLDAVRALKLPDEPGIAYLAGEARTRR